MVPLSGVWTVIQHRFSRLWNLSTPNTHDGDLEVSSTQWSLNLLKPVHKTGRIKMFWSWFSRWVYGMWWRRIHLTMIFSLHLKGSVRLIGNLSIPVVFTLTEFITSRKQIHGTPTFVSFGDITLTFPTVNHDILFVRLTESGVSSKLGVVPWSKD